MSPILLPTPQSRLHQLVKSSTQLIQRQGGVVRGYDYWGAHYLPQPIKRHQETHQNSRLWFMHFDTNPSTLLELQRRLNSDVDVLRASLLKVDEGRLNAMRRRDMIKADVGERTVKRIEETEQW